MEREKRLCNERATIPSITKMFAALFIPYFIYFNCMRIKMKNTYVIRLKLIILIGWKPRKSLIIKVKIFLYFKISPTRLKVKYTNKKKGNNNFAYGVLGIKIG